MSTYFNNDNNIFNANLLDTPDYVRDFLDYEEAVLGRAPSTLRCYYLSIDLFIRYLIGRETKEKFEDIETVSFPIEKMKKVEKTDIEAFLSYCEKKRKNGPEGLHSKLAALKAFFKYCCSVTGIFDMDPTMDVSFPERQSSKLKVLTDKDIERVKKASKYGLSPERNNCIVLLLLNYGLRLTELTALNVDDINEDVLKVGQGDRMRELKIDKDTLNALNSWLKARESYFLRTDKALFVGIQKGTRMTGRSVEKVLNNVFAAAGIEYKGYNANALRQTAATKMGQKEDVDAEELMKTLGNITTKKIKQYIQ